ncbi:hypothetical protein JW911_04455 [Candidatus Peregrinibacteria bacterium]|nr:hypothetical protein [Candidatus Peregrinibacteria bacterium]
MDLEKQKSRPAVDSLKSKPETLKAVLQNATPAELDAIEAAMGPVVERLRTQRETAKKTSLDQNETKIKTLITLLSPKLAEFKGDIRTLKALLRPFCEKYNLELCPRPEDTRAVRPGLNVHWESEDGKIGIRIMPDAIWMYKRNRESDLWEPSNPE